LKPQILVHALIMTLALSMILVDSMEPVQELPCSVLHLPAPVRLLSANSELVSTEQSTKEELAMLITTTVPSEMPVSEENATLEQENRAPTPIFARLLLATARLDSV